MDKTVAVRLEGGLGDHVLGMRILPFIRRRYPGHKILIYSDCEGNRAQLDVAAMSPFVARVIPVFQDRSRVTANNLGRLENIDGQYLALFKKADVFVDGWNYPLFIKQSVLLDVPYYKILATRPRLKLPPESISRASEILTISPPPHYIAINFGKYGAGFLRTILPSLQRLLLNLLEDPRVHILNMFSRTYDFPHWPEPERSKRRALVEEESQVIAEICEWNSRILPIVDQSIPTVTALLSRCSYFIGIDNGIKHLAWALGIPRTFFLTFMPNEEFILRYIPDFHRLSLVLNSKIDVPSVLRAVKKSLYRSAV
jgi:hypothetical protein